MLRTVGVEPVQFHKRRVDVPPFHSFEQGRAWSHMCDPVDKNAAAV